MWFFTVIATMSGLAGLGLSLRNYWLLRYKPVHERQMQLQTGLKKVLRLMDEHHLAKSLNQVGSRMPSKSGKEQLENLIEFLRPHVNDYIAPTPAQIHAFLADIRVAVDEWDNILQPPSSDQIFVDGDREGRERLAALLETVRSDTRCIVDGITQIEKKPLGTRKQQRLFSALDARQVQPALPSPVVGLK